MSHTMSSRTRGAALPANARIRVASVPAGHVYVRHLTGAAADDSSRVHRLPDPRVLEPRAPASQWWPPRMLEPQWVREHLDEFDVFHVHFGFDACPVDQLDDLVSVLRDAGKPLVYTLHDLRNPHHEDRRVHDAQLDVLVPAADAVITLSAGAAREIRSRWGRDAVVVPHPHVVDLPTMEHIAGLRSDRRADTVRVGLHLKSLRACMDADAVLPALVRAVEEMPSAVLQVNVHRDVVEPGGARHDAGLTSMLESLGDRIDLRVHDFFSDAQLWQYLSSLDVSVLPYRFGTHSGWLEACRDLGTAVVAPTCGFYADQGPVHSYRLDETTFDEQSLVDAVTSAAAAGSRTITADQRREQRDRIARAHHDLYRSLIGAR